jgi:hypothetical protein
MSDKSIITVVGVAARSVDVARSLNPSLQTFDQWLAANKARIPLE